MGILEQAGITDVYHYTPLHYLPFIARGQALLSKPAITAAGFPRQHFRSMSKNQDVARGFARYVHLTVDPSPPILRAKLAAGFPHVKLAVPVVAVDVVEFALCRFNVAMTRYLRKNGKPGFAESPTNGYYYDSHQIPVARQAEHKRSMLAAHLGRGTMIEVLVPDRFLLPLNTTVVCFASHDCQVAEQIMGSTNCGWDCVVDAGTSYTPSDSFRRDVRSYIDMALADSSWRGNGLEFDRL